MADKKEIVELISELVKIESINSWLIPEGSGEKNAQVFMQEYLSRLGIESHFEEVSDGHYNLAGCLPGSGGGKGLTLYAHADTVGCELWRDRAFVPELRGDKLYGLGAADDKGHCAAIMLALAEIKKNGIPHSGDIHFCFVADEEGETSGTMAYVKKHEPEAALILEAAPLSSINYTHQGFGWLNIITRGKAGHGSAGAVSADAIYHMAEVIVRLQRNQREIFAPNADPQNGETVYHTSTIRGGTDFASYPEECVLGIEIGTQAGETIQNRVDEIEAIFREVKEICPNFDGRVEVVLARDPFVARGHEELYEILADSIEKIHGVPARAVGDNSWGDAQLFQDAGFPTLGVGADGGNLHAPEEWVSISQMEQLIAVTVDVIGRYCR
ncbi:M20 family metallopeptidase [Bacilliculturomica massiliensis]|uniref:M20 family metallopeptidase n=1 Tax=Bacilliculturomica massiliensis TaxID=1917867 RepID=UPI0010324F71|nr:M20/M25/M40 family metallo-hydrolase [Bacilliculturomica massiliensis]